MKQQHHHQTKVESGQDFFNKGKKKEKILIIKDKILYVQMVGFVIKTQPLFLKENLLGTYYK